LQHFLWTFSDQSADVLPAAKNNAIISYKIIIGLKKLSRHSMPCSHKSYSKSI